MEITVSYFFLSLLPVGANRSHLSFMLLFKEGEWPGILKITKKEQGFILTGSEIIP